MVKLSAPFRLVPSPDSTSRLEAFVEALLDSFGIERCVWGSDWPFLAVRGEIRYGDLLDGLARWLPGEKDRERVLWQNPVRLFGFME